MPIRNFSFIAAVLALLLGSSWVTGCGLQQKGKGQLANQKSNSSSQDIDDSNGAGLTVIQLMSILKTPMSIMTCVPLNLIYRIAEGQ